MTPAELIAQLEGCKLEAYPDPATGGEPYTIGYGHTGDVKPGDVITQHQAEVILDMDLQRTARVVDALVKVPITSSQRAALISFEFNEGAGRLTDPNCKILPLLNAGDHLGAAGQFLHWTMAGGVHGFLLKRRAAEVEAFLSELGVL